MNATRTSKRLRPQAKSLADCMRDFLTPAVWKQAQAAGRRRRRGQRWALQPLVLVLLFSTWCCGDSQSERFETAKAVCVACLPKRKRPGQTVQGFQKALARLPMNVLRALAAHVRQRLATVFDLVVDGFIPLGCDGSRIECPRAEELEARLGQAGKDGSAPTLWLTALVHLRLGIPWAWRWGKGTASERAHLLALVRTLPALALVVCDAGYVGADVAAALIQAQTHFLIRVSSTVDLYTETRVRATDFREGEVYYWPQAWQRKKRPPLRLRLIRVRSRSRRTNVWLLTNVVDRRRLPGATAGKFYRWRWENEGLFRTYKRTLAKMKLRSRSLRLVHREAEGSMLALQLLLAQGTQGLRCRSATETSACSPRQVLLAVRQEMQGYVKVRRHGNLQQRLRQAQREQRVRRSPKEKRPWPRRKPHQPPGAPNLLTLRPQQKALISRLEKVAA